ncbi:transcription elongation factor GreB [Marinospirillum alkaliphilum]|uniref:Transcription elongation factor GreB n=1 Tax=Marinospirillum alkaliphilum DSM 21637 TaxID=1122209 RepID=A0A1K1YEP2_9GAMM|nr:transcription elongation factor GreB [Marinospirillum alkaliphilum]SFX60417.1 transcription elongation factor GreB [Marinospirillum alkaliphilum DSM 21637]
MKGRNMSRWRDPAKDPRAEEKTALITPEGYARMQSTRDFLWRVRHPELAQKVREAAANGDRSENADYTYNKRELNRTLARIRFLDQRLEVLKVVDRPPADPQRVYFGAWVTLEDEAGEESCWRLVGPDEADAGQGLLSIDAPRARLLLGRRLDDEVLLPTPEGEAAFVITDIRYAEI